MNKSTVICIEDLGKKYMLGRQREPYVALRDIITDGLSAFANKVRRPFGSSSTNGNTLNSEVFWALKDVSFDVKQGDRIGIIGRNGAGKSTLLKILSRITEPTAGRVRIRGRVASLLEVGTGFHPELTGRENIFLNGAILGMRREEIKWKFDEIVDFAEIERFLDTPVKRYSSGMYVRLAFAVAAHLEPEILIVDEVLAVGDAQFQKKCLGKMEDVSTKQGRTVLFVSHNMAAIRALCSNAVWLDSGCIRKTGGPEEVIHDYLLEGAQMFKSGHKAPPSARVALSRVWTENFVGEQSSNLDVAQPFSVFVEFEVREGVSDVDIGIWLRNVRNVPVCFTNMSELGGGKVPYLKPGTYKGSLHVPALFLVPDVYFLSVKAHVPNVATEDHMPEAAQFCVVETGSSLARYDDAGRYGVVFGNFTWDLSFKGE